MHSSRSIRRSDVPLVSPIGLIQESLWPDGWSILVASIMLNCTSRKQVEKVWSAWTHLAPGPTQLLATDPSVTKDTIRSLGFVEQRTKNLYAMTERFVKNDWSDPRELPGIGEYGARSYEIFVLGILGDEEPKDHALVQYHRWAVQMIDQSM